MKPFTFFGTIMMKNQMTLSSDIGGESFSAPLKTTLGISSTVINFKTIMDTNNVMHFLYVPLNESSTLCYSKSQDYGDSVGGTIKISPLEADTADMDWNQDKESSYIVWLNPQEYSIYFSDSLEEATDEQPPVADAGPSTTDGGGGGGCVIKACLN
jgi:hypothetical protein